MNKNEVLNIVVTGKSGAGKQPRIDVLVKEFGFQQLSTGNIFREYLGKFRKSGFKGDIAQFYDQKAGKFKPDKDIVAALKKAGVKDDPDAVVLGLKAETFVSSGKFVPDEITNELFSGYFSKMGFKKAVLDGYPRTVDQAKYLLKLVKEKKTNIGLVVIVDNEDDAIIKRTIGRRICPKCGKVYHLEHKPPKDGKFCNDCNLEVIQRSDDTEEKIRSRLKEFQQKCKPAIAVLEKTGIPVVNVAGNLPVFTDEAVRKSVLDAIAPAFKK